MPTETPTATETTTETPAESTQEAPNEPIQLPDDHPLVKALAATRAELKQAKSEAHAAAEKAQKWDEAESANKTELEKANERVAELEKQAADATLNALRANIAAETGVPASLLSGADEESLRASATALLDFRGQTPKAPTSDGQGQVGKPINASAGQLTEADLARMTAEEKVEAMNKGLFNDLLAGKR